MAKSSLVKKAYEKQSYTPEQVQEMHRCMFGWTDPSTKVFECGPVYFAKNYVKIQHPKRGEIPFILYPYQEKMMETYLNNNKVIVLSARQTGKQLCVDTKIPTPTGWTTMGQLQPGDLVIGSDGKPTKVDWVSDTTIPSVAYKIYFSTGETQLACSDHEWIVEWKHKKGLHTVTTQQMVDAGVSIGTKNEGRFKVPVMQSMVLPDVELPLDPYLLGIWLGDGTSAEYAITSHTDDHQITEQLFVQCDNVVQRTYGSATAFQYRCKELNPILKQLNVQNNKHIPIQYLRASHNQRLALLQGLMDTDGTVDSLGRGGCDITLANLQLSNDVFHLISSLGLKPTFKTRYVKDKVRYEIKFTAYREQLEVFRLSRKLNLMKVAPSPSRVNSTKKRTIQKIERVDGTPMKCIAVDNADSSYVFGDSCIVTHNSQTSAIFLLWFAIFNPTKLILIAANKNANAMEMIGRIAYSYECLPMWLKPGVTHDGFNKHEIKFDNGSRIVSTATSESSGRGMAISLLFLDEFAFVQKGVQEEFWTSILPTLSTGGACIMTSTPNGATDKFASIWRSANFESNTDGLQFVPIHVKWDEPPGRDERFKRDQMAMLGELKWRQEYQCVGGQTMLTLMDDSGNMFELSIEHLHELLSHQDDAGSLNTAVA